MVRAGAFGAAFAGRSHRHASAGSASARSSAASRSRSAVEEGLDGRRASPTEALARFSALIAAFDDPDRAYVSRARPMFETRYESPYDHLARVREWALVESEEDLEWLPPRKAVTVDKATRKAQADASEPARLGLGVGQCRLRQDLVLAQRVIRLLLAGTDPARILCLTFTRAAAAEMAKRVFDDPRRMDDARRRQARHRDRRASRAGGPTRTTLAEARRLFARALETPGGLKIQTIHAFCERLLHQFPFEANVAGHFEVLDERDADGARRHCAARRCWPRRPASPTGRSAGRCTTVLGAGQRLHAHELAIKEFIDKRDRLRALDRARRLARRTRSRELRGRARPRRRRERRAAARRDPRRVRACAERLRRAGRAPSRRRQERPGGRRRGWRRSSTPTTDDGPLRPPISTSGRRPTASSGPRRASSPRRSRTTGRASPRCSRRSASGSTPCSTGSRRRSATNRPPRCSASPTRRSTNTSG